MNEPELGPSLERIARALEAGPSAFEVWTQIVVPTLLTVAALVLSLVSVTLTRRANAIAELASEAEEAGKRAALGAILFEMSNKILGMRLAGASPSEVLRAVADMSSALAPAQLAVTHTSAVEITAWVSFTSRLTPLRANDVDDWMALNTLTAQAIRDWIAVPNSVDQLPPAPSPTAA